MDSHENWEPWNASIRPALEFKCYNAAFFGWTASLFVVEARTNLEFSSVLFSHYNRPANPFTPTGTLLVPNYGGFSIFESFNLKQAETASSFVFGLGVLDHNSLTFSAADLIHPLFQMFFIFADRLVNQFDYLIIFSDLLFKLFDSAAKISFE